MRTGIKERAVINFMQHSPTGLWVAVSRDLPGLQVTGHSPEEIVEKLPDILGAMAEEQFGVTALYVMERDESVPPDFTPPAYIAKTKTAALAA